MEISSAPGRGCTVQIEVPLPRRHISLPSSPNPESPEPVSPIDPIHLAAAPDEMHIERKVGLAGFDLGPVGTYGLERLQTCLERQYRKLGCEIVPIEEADLVMIDGRQEENASGAEYIRQIKTGEIVFLVTHDHEPDPSVVAVERELGKNVRRFRKPATPSTLRESLFPGHSKAIQAEIPTADGIHRTPISSPDQVDANGHDVHSKGQPKAHFDDDSLHRPRCRPSSLFAGLSQLWKPKNMPMEDAVASLCLGDYFSSRRRTSLIRIPSNASSGPESSADPTTPTIASIESGDAPQMASLSQSTSVETDSDPELLKVLVVEDNAINRKILVKILSSKIVSDL